jgi:hypothetical protein
MMYFIDTHFTAEYRELPEQGNQDRFIIPSANQRQFDAALNRE